MKKYGFKLFDMKYILMVILMTASLSVQAKCIPNSIGAIVCSQPGGDIKKNSIGAVVCGKGQCVKNSIGSFECSKIPSGGAAKNIIGAVQCVGGCEYASASMCVIPSY